MVLDNSSKAKREWTQKPVIENISRQSERNVK
jgi:hypothetical protein